MAGTSSAETEPSSQIRAFISHSSSDAELAQSLCAHLEAKGIGCWIAPRDATPSRPYADEIVRGIESADALVLLASAQAITSSNVLNEVEQAHKNKKVIYTVLINKPQIGRDLDYYISRLHWIELGVSTEKLAETLAEVLRGRKRWDEVAPGPSLRRTVLYRRDAFQGAALATLLVLVLAGTGLYYWVNRSLNLDFRRLGQVTVSSPPEDPPASASSAVRIRAHVWLLAEGVQFSGLKLRTAAYQRDGSVNRSEHSAWPMPEQVGSVENIDFPLPQTTVRLTTCLSVPSPALHRLYRVTQVFDVKAGGTGEDDEVMISPHAEAKVSVENLSPCGSPD
jgi:TIR domain